ncbi:MAG: YkgJ family cysteine cluster protein [Thermodesulfobacteriota bacterium]
MEMGREVIDSMITESRQLLRALHETREQVPRTICDRRTCCCSLLPESSFLEFLQLLEAVGRMESNERQGVISKIATYYFINPIERRSCPFLSGTDCLVYEIRPFTCRAYGLWSKEFYDRQAEMSRQAKMQVVAGWKALGIDLSGNVLDFRQEYCLNVKTCDGVQYEDAFLNDIWAEILTLDAKAAPYDSLYRERYFSDLSFALISLVIGPQRALVEKVNVVKEAVISGTRTKLRRILDEILQNMERTLSPLRS